MHARTSDLHSKRIRGADPQRITLDIGPMSTMGADADRVPVQEAAGAHAKTSGRHAKSIPGADPQRVTVGRPTEEPVAGQSSRIPTKNVPEPELT